MNTKLKCILLDDELPGLAYLRTLCEQLGNVEVVKAFNDPLKFIAESKNLQYDLCILDIEMPGVSGLEVAKQIRGKPVIFTTAYKEYAAEAFDLEAVDYVRKPIQKERLEKAIAKAIQQVKDNTLEKQFMQVNTSKGKALLYFDQILHITTAETDKRDKEVMLTDHKPFLVKNISFEKFLRQLPAGKFCQVNKKEIIALQTVQFYSHNEITTSIKDISGKPKIVSLSDNYRENFLRFTKP